MRTWRSRISPYDSLVDMAQAALSSGRARSSPSVIPWVRVALEMLRLAPERIVRLGLLDTGVHPRRDAEVASRQALVDLAFEQGMGALADKWLPPMVHQARAGDEAFMARLKAMVMRYTPEQHRGQIRALLDRRPDPRPLLSTISCPLVMVGRQDRWSPPAQHEEIAAAIPNAEMVADRGQRPHDARRAAGAGVARTSPLARL